MDLSERTEFCQLLFYFFGNFISVQEAHIKSWFDVPTTHRSSLPEVFCEKSVRKIRKIVF